MNTTTPEDPSAPDSADLLAGPGDDRYERGRQAFNLTIDQRPDYVVPARNERDVISAVQLAAKRGIRIAPQRTGHAASSLPTLANTILLRTDQLKGVEIDPHARTARVQAGARWADVVPAASELGLAALHGASPSVGIVGYTLTGGLSWYSREHGLAAGHVRAFEIVTADGRLRRVDEQNEPEIFWALRGGNGRLGVVTALEFDLFAMPGVYAGALFFPWERTGEVMSAWSDRLREVPDALASVARVLRFPPLPQIPEPLRGNSFVLVEAVCTGPEAVAKELLEPLRALGAAMDTFATVAPAGIGELHMDPQEPVPFTDDHQLLDELPPDALQQLVELIGPGSDSPLLSFELRHLGGALARDEPGHGALGRVRGEFLTFGVGLVTGADRFEAIRERLAKVRATLAPHDAGYALPGFTLGPAEPSRFYEPATIARLQQVRREVDPDGLFATDSGS
jgi:FAD/FMN-containing dehydrogenase